MIQKLLSSPFILAFCGIFLLNSIHAKGQIHDSTQVKLQKLLDEFPAKIGIAAHFQAKGSNTKQVIFSYHSQDGFISMSTIKLPIAIACFIQVEAGKLNLSKTVQFNQKDLESPSYSPMRDSVEDTFTSTIKTCLLYSCKYSDNIATDKQLDALGGVQKTQEILLKLGMKGIQVGTHYRDMDSSRLALNLATPEGMNELLFALANGKLLNQTHSHLLTSWMRDTPTGQDRLKGDLPKSIPVVHKTGTYYFNETSPVIALNDVGYLELPEGRLFISAFINQSKLPAEHCSALIAKVAQLLSQELSSAD
ncbi:class A beta-lactamase, subclass A2 [Bacteroidota bacterium]